jgi:hypothetical protein
MTRMWQLALGRGIVESNRASPELLLAKAQAAQSKTEFGLELSGQPPAVLWQCRGRKSGSAGFSPFAR